MKSDSPSGEVAADLASELSLLSRQQYEALQKASYLHMAEEEAEEYDRRRVRIGEICGLLVKFRTKGH